MEPETDVSQLSIGGGSLVIEKPKAIEETKTIKHTQNVVEKKPEPAFSITPSITIAYHKKMYAEAKERIDEHKSNIEVILDIVDEFKDRRIMGQKFNYALQSEI